MAFVKIINYRYTILAIALALMFAGCSPSVVSVRAIKPTQAQQEMATQVVTLVPENTPTAVQTSDTTAPMTHTIDLQDLAQSVSDDMVAAVPASDNAAPWDIYPQYKRITLAGYPISGHLMPPQIFIYPAQDLHNWTESLGKQVDNLRALLASQQVGDRLPVLPEYNAAQVIYSQVVFLRFKNGQGVRFLTEYDQAVLPINNHELFYTFQGLTDDGKYYVAAVMPVNYPGLPENETAISQAPAQFTSDFPGYLTGMKATLDTAAYGDFTPDLARLDAMIMSLEVK
jgi:hypothetical protein